MRKHKRLVKLLSIITIAVFIFSNILTTAWAGDLKLDNTFAAPGLIDPFGPLDPGGWAGMKPNPQQGMQELASSLVPKTVPADVKSLNGLADRSDNVDPVTGNINITSNDLTIPSPNMSLSLNRVFTGQPEDSGPLGYGWAFSYNQYIQIYEDFKIVEYRGDGNHQVYNFTENNPDAMVDSFDGDPLIYYDLDDGYYTAESPTNFSTLTRHSADSYTVKHEFGMWII